MKRLLRPFLAIAIVLFGVQCQDRQSPVAVEGFDQLEPSATQSEIEAMIAALFKTGHKTTATQRFRTAVRHLNKGNTSLAQKTILELIQWTLQRNAAGQLQDPNGNAAPTKNEALAELINAWLEFFGLGGGDPIPPEAFEFDGAVGTCGPAGCTIVTGTEFAGVRVPPGALGAPTAALAPAASANDVVIFIHRLPDSPGPLNTELDQYPLFYFFGSNPEVEFNIPADFAVCTLDDPPHPIGAPPGAELRLAHNVSEGIEVLPLGASDFLDCTDAAPLEVEESAFRTRALDSFLARLVGPFSPNLLYAMPGELGGKASNFSPFGAVDIESGGPIETETTLDAQPNPAFAGDQITLTATVSPPPTSEEAEVEFFVYGEGLASLGTASVNGFGVAELVVDTACFCESANCFEPGTWTFVAEFLGTDSHAASTSNDEEVFIDEYPCTA